MREYPFENYFFAEMCSGSEAGSYLRLIDSVHHSTLGVRVMKKKKWSTRGVSAPLPGRSHATAPRAYKYTHIYIFQ